jgi:hypothetical protein
MLIHGPPGCGKSYVSRVSLADKYGADNIGIKSPDSRWWTPEMAVRPIIVIEDYEPSGLQHISVNQWKLFTDVYPFIIEVKGGNLVISPRIIIITSNYNFE